MQDFPISTHITETGTLVIRQPLSLDDPQDFVEIEVSEGQATRLNKEIMAHFAKKTAKRVSDAALAGSAEKFEAFWMAYPSARRIDKSGCKRKWIQRGLDGIADTIINHVCKSRESDWIKDGGKYVPLITTYINQSRWEASEGQQAAFTIPSV